MWKHVVYSVENWFVHTHTAAYHDILTLNANLVALVYLLLRTQKNNQFYVTSLIIPNQMGTSDTCTTKDEEAIFEYQDERGLITLGWIHVCISALWTQFIIENALFH